MNEDLYFLIIMYTKKQIKSKRLEHLIKEKNSILASDKIKCFNLSFTY